MASDQGTYDSPAAKDISLDDVTRILQDAGATNIYVKKLSPNDNSKNQLYLGRHLTDVPFIPAGQITASPTTSMKTARTKIKCQAFLDLSWVDAKGSSFKSSGSRQQSWLTIFYQLDSKG